MAAPSGPSRPRAATPNVTAVLVKDALATWTLPVLGALAFLGSTVATVTGALAPPQGIVATVATVVVLLAWATLRPVGGPKGTTSDRLMAAVIAPVWTAALVWPFWAAMIPTSPHGPPATVAPTTTFPVALATGDATRVELVVEGDLPRAPSNGMTLPITYTLTLGNGSTVAGRLDQQASATDTGPVHVAAVHALAVDGPLTVTALELSPDTAPPLTITARPPRALPWPLFTAGVCALLGLALVLDRRPALAENDGGFTLATGAIAGTAAVLLTSHAATPTLSTLAGAAILGGVLGYIVAAALWWLAKKSLGNAAAR